MRITFPLIINWFGGITSNIYSYYYPRIGYVTSQSNPNEFCHSDNTYDLVRHVQVQSQRVLSSRQSL